MASTHNETSEKVAEARTDAPKTLPADGPPRPAEAGPPSHRGRRWLVGIGLVAGLAVGGYYLKPTVETMLNTVSTDDAYVNGHVTLVAPRVSGQVSRVLVDDNYRVKKGDLLVQLDKEPYQVQVAIKQAAVRGGRGGPGGRPGEGRGVWRPRRGPSLPARTRHRGRPHPDRQSPCQGGDAQEQEGDPGAGAGQPQAGRGARRRAGASARKSSTSGGKRSRSMRRLSIRPCRRSSTRPGSASAFPPSRPRATT